jgi:hypothetical protein
VTRPDTHESETQRQQDRDEVLKKIVADYDRRKSKPWGRFLLWLLRKTT